MTMPLTGKQTTRRSAGATGHLLFLCLCGCLLSTPAHADLPALIDDMKSYSARFTQTIMGGRNEILQQSTGQVSISTPSRFKWVVDDPFPQTLVTVNDKLYLYDPDLEQLTVEPLEAAIAGTPALILTGGVEDLSSMFEISEFHDGDSKAYSLYPKDADALFAQIRLRFDGQSRLSHLEIEDHLGQLTQVAFSDITLNAPIDSAEFAFEVPQGTEVVGEL